MPVTIGGSGPITGVTSINTSVSDTELGYLDGVTSALQTQINSKANDSSQGLYFITANTFSGSSAVNINNCFTSTYDNYRIVLSGVKAASGSVGLRFRLRASAADNTSSNYQYGRMYVGLVDNIAFASVNNTTAAFWEPCSASDAYGSAIVIDVLSPALTERTAFIANAASNTMSLYNGLMTVTTAYDGFTVYPASSTLSGTVRVYGYKN